MANINRHKIKDLESYSKLCLEVERYGFYIRVQNPFEKSNRLFSPRTFAGKYGAELAVNLFSKVLCSSVDRPVFKRSFGLVTFLQH